VYERRNKKRGTVMAYKFNNMIFHYPSERSKDYEGWEVIDCGCNEGATWLSPLDPPDGECFNCGGAGRLYRHIVTGQLCFYKIGPIESYGRDQSVIGNNEFSVDSIGPIWSSV
jgi:hypothetical protein